MSLFALETTPFSHYGAWLSISRLKSRAEPYAFDDLYLRSYNGGALSIAKLVFLHNGQPLDIDPTVTACRLSWLHAAGSAELCFDGPQSLRLRGQGLELQILAVVRSEVFATAPNIATLNVLPASSRYQFECLQGKLAWRSIRDDTTARESDVLISLAPDQNDAWELAIDEFTSTWQPRARDAFTNCVVRMDREFQQWLTAMPPAPTQWSKTRELAAYINWTLTMSPRGFLRRWSMYMSKNWMCGVWSWDHCFNALALAQGKPELAWEQLLLMVDYQDEHGCYPDMIADRQVHYNYTKPPIHGWAVSELLQRSSPSVETIATIYDSLAAWTRWWLHHRRLPQQPLPYYLHGYDSGWDNSTVFDQGTPLISPDLAAYLILQLDCLAELAEQLQKSSEAAHWLAQAQDLYTALIDELWTGERFIARLAADGTEVSGRSLIYCMPIVLGKRLPKNIAQRLVAQLETFLTDYGLATEHPDSEYYIADGYWRGPIWPSSSYLIASGLQRCGYIELANRIAERFCRLCAEHGFAETFDAMTGAGLRDRSFSWTASVFLLFAEQCYFLEK